MFIIAVIGITMSMMILLEPCVSFYTWEGFLNDSYSIFSSGVEATWSDQSQRTILNMQSKRLNEGKNIDFQQAYVMEMNTTRQDRMKMSFEHTEQYLRSTVKTVLQITKTKIVTLIHKLKKFLYSEIKMIIHWTKLTPTMV
jgi:hypothetical protein